MTVGSRQRAGGTGAAADCTVPAAPGREPQSPL